MTIIVRGITVSLLNTKRHQ